MRSTLLATYFIAVAGSAFGFDREPARSFTKETPDGSCVLVMLLPKSYRIEEPNSPGAALRKKYAQSGLYLKTDATRPIWTCDWYGEHVFPSNDRAHVVRCWNDDPHVTTGKTSRDFVREIAGAPALTVYKNGQEVWTAKVGELLNVNKFGSDNGGDLGTWFFWGHVDLFNDEAGLVTLKGAGQQETTINFRDPVSPVNGERGRCGNDGPTGLLGVPGWVIVAFVGVGVVLAGATIFLVTLLLFVRR